MRSASVSGAGLRSWSSSSARIPSPTGVPPGSRVTSGRAPTPAMRAASRATWVDLPEPSPPSNVTKSPRTTALLAPPRARVRAGFFTGAGRRAATAFFFRFGAGRSAASPFAEGALRAAFVTGPPSRTRVGALTRSRASVPFGSRM